jgi:hypothetical protein
MPKTLLLFLTSPTVDTYVNAIAHAYDKLEVDRYIVVRVKNSPATLRDEREKPQEIRDRILTQIGLLAKGKYADRQLPSAPELSIYQRMYDGLKLGDEEIDYTNLRIELVGLIKKYGGTNQCIVDLTGASKSLAVDIVVMCLAIKLNMVFMFDLNVKIDRNRPEDFLYHRLRQNFDYDYYQFTRSPVVLSGQTTYLRKRGVFAVSLMLGVAVIAIAAVMFGVSDSNPIFAVIGALSGFQTIIAVITQFAQPK